MKWSILAVIAAAAFLSAALLRTGLPKHERYSIQPAIPPLKMALGCTPAYAPSSGETIPPLTGWGNYRWKITTASDSAQFYFNQGMAMYYAFHIVEARASFYKATLFDSSCAMAWWAQALAFGPNINDFEYQRPPETFPAVTNALRFKHGCTPVEKALIDAISVRYSADTTADQQKLNEQYKNAMAGLYKQFPKNADVAVLYADALMLLHPWDLYNHDFTPKPWTKRIVSVIKSALRLSPYHPGANHYFIHAVEASGHPAEALTSAKILETAMPSVAHITHMPSHIYIRTGYYNKGVNLNTKALEGYNNYLQAFAPVSEAAFLYSLHNLHMKMACAQMAGNYSQAISAANQLQAQIPADYLNMRTAMGNYLQYLHQSPLITYVRFGKWKDILNENRVDTLPYTAVLQHFARGLAYAKTKNVAAAKTELALMTQKIKNPVLKEPFAPFSAAYDAALVALNLLKGTIAVQDDDISLAIGYFRLAVTAEDQIIYNEPRDWMLPARHHLGEALLQAGKYQEAMLVFKKDLQINPSNAWSLTGILHAAQRLNLNREIKKTRQQLRKASSGNDVEIFRPVF